ncbi:MAG: hypothetical protein IPN77_33640 [Sandaracinaceae bacterium]|nr:hypothetical protein [Sandaracinaceae bacterium]
MSDVVPSFADPMRYLEGYGMLADFGDPGGRLLALVGVRTLIDAFSLLPFEEDAALCLEYEGGALTSGAEINVMQPLGFPYVEDSTLSLDGTPCNGRIDVSAVVESGRRTASS